MDGAFMEAGPFRLHTDKEHLELNNGSWHKHANLLFVDQPVGTGMSSSDTDSYIKELPEMAAHMITFLEKYFEIFPERQGDEFYLAGESYAGQYIPYLARAILDKNLNKTSPFMKLLPEKTARDLDLEVLGKRDGDNNGIIESHDNGNNGNSQPWIDLKAVMIGNGWIDPVSQYLTYLPFAYQTGLIKHGSSIAASVESKHKKCVEWFQEHPDTSVISVSVCESIVNTMLKELFQSTGLNRDDPNACVNMYDIRLRDTFSSCGMNWPGDLVNVTPYLRRKDVLEALHLPTTTGWKECSGPVGSAFKARHSKPAVGIIPTLIEDNVHVVMFNGDQDLICNHVGNEQLIKHMSWGPDANTAGATQKLDKREDAKEEASKDSKQEPAISVADAHLTGMSRDGGFRPGEDTHEWYVDNAVAGTIQTGRNLTYVKVYNASHMVPLDLPMVAQAMAYHFLNIPGYLDKDMIKSKVGESEEKPADAQDNKELQDGKEKEKDGSWRPYYKAGAFVLVVCILAALFLGFFVWKNRQLTDGIHDTSFSRGRGDKNKRVRSVHYEDELDDYEAGRVRGGFGASDERPRGFFQSILAGVSRWKLPDKIRAGVLKKGEMNSRYQQLELDGPAGAGSSRTNLVSDDAYNDSSVQLETFRDSPVEGDKAGNDHRDSLDDILNDLDGDDEHNASRS